MSSRLSPSSYKLLVCFVTLPGFECDQGDFLSPLNTIHTSSFPQQESRKIDFTAVITNLKGISTQGKSPKSRPSGLSWHRHLPSLLPRGFCALVSHPRQEGLILALPCLPCVTSPLLVTLAKVAAAACN